MYIHFVFETPNDFWKINCVCVQKARFFFFFWPTIAHTLNTRLHFFNRSFSEKSEKVGRKSRRHCCPMGPMVQWFLLKRLIFGRPNSWVSEKTGENSLMAYIESAGYWRLSRWGRNVTAYGSLCNNFNRFPLSFFFKKKQLRVGLSQRSVGNQSSAAEIVKIVLAIARHSQ